MKMLKSLYMPISGWISDRTKQPPESRPTYIQDIITGKRRLLSMGRPKPRSPSPPPLTPVQRLSTRRKYSSAHRVAACRQRQRERLAIVNKEVEEGMIAGIATRYKTPISESIAESI